MPLSPPARPGQSFAEIDTPALIIDLDAFERNLVTMAAFAEATGVRLRPHAKTHKSPEIALRQIAAAKEMTVSALLREWLRAYQEKEAKEAGK